MRLPRDLAESQGKEALIEDRLTLRPVNRDRIKGIYMRVSRNLGAEIFALTPLPLVGSMGLKRFCSTPS